jgi:Beta-propeller repeat
MKMRASLSRISIYAALTLIIPVFLLFIQAHGLRTRPLKAIAGQSFRATGDAAKTSPIKADAHWIEAYGKLPLSFEENQGQTDPQVKFLSRGGGYILFLTPEEVVLSLHRAKPVDASPLHRATYMRELRKGHSAEKDAVLRMHLDGANPTPDIAGLDRLQTRVDYFIGKDSKNWRTNVPSYGRVKYRGVYPGVDLVLYGNGRHLEYDFVVTPGADPKAVAFDITGARKLEINSQGSLVMNVPGGKVEFEKPVVYQETNGERREVGGKYALSGKNRVAFAVADYDKTQPLIIDPVFSWYSTYLLGSSAGDIGYSIAADSSGNAYITGATFNTSFPVSTNAVPPASPQGSPTVFVAKLNPGGTALLYASYLSGEVEEFGFGIAVDSADMIYVTGQTFSTEFPVSTNAYNCTGSPTPGNANGVAFVTVLNPSQNQTTPNGSLVYSSYLGGDGGDYGNAIATDGAGNVYIVGLTASANFPQSPGAVPPPSGTTLPNITGSAFLTQLNITAGNATCPSPSTNELIYSSILGGNGANTGPGVPADQAFGVAIDSSSNAYIAGTTTSTNLPTTANAVQTASPTGNTKGTVFLTRINTTKTSGALIYSTYLGGNASVSGDFGFAIALGPAPTGYAYVTGSTTSTSGLPITSGSYPTTPAASGVAFIGVIDTNATATPSSPIFYSLLGGSGGDTGHGIQVDGLGNAYVAGVTDSTDFPLTSGAFETEFAPTSVGYGFIAEMQPLALGKGDLLYSTYFGGSGNGSNPDEAEAIALDSQTTPNVYITGQTWSSDFPVNPPATATPPALQTSLTPAGGGDAFVARLNLVPTLQVVPTSITFTPAQTIGTTSPPQFVTLTNNTGDAITLAFVSSMDFGTTTTVTPPPAACGASLASGASCQIGVTFTPSVTPPTTETGTLTINYTAEGILNTQTVALSGTGTLLSLNLTSSLTFSGQYVTTTSPSQPAIFTNSTAAAVPFTTSISGDYAFTVDAASPASCSGATPSVPASSACQFDITFKPAIGAACSDTGTFTVTPSGSAALTTALTGTPWEVSISAPATFSVNRGSSGSFAVTGTWTCGYTGTATIVSSGGPTKTTITISGSPISPANPTATVTIATQAFVLPPESIPVPPVSPRQIVLLLLALALLLMLPTVRRFRTRLSLAGVVLGFVLLAGCSGGPAGTPGGTTTLTLTSTSSGVSQPVTVMVTVNR